MSDPVKLPVRSRRRRHFELFATGGIGALAVMLTQTPPSWAQSYLGRATTNFVANSQTATISESAGQTSVTVNNPKAIISWIPDDQDGNVMGPINFQSSGTTTTFKAGNAGADNFTVLNILTNDTSRAIQFNGATIAQNSNGSTGGNLWFYSPTGIIVGATGSFNVGSLLLTANAPQDMADDFDIANPRFVASDPGAGIDILPGASITASNYIGLLAPRINQGGTVSAGGEVAYVAAEDATLTLPDPGGLFAIQITTGTDAQNSDGTTISHTGVTQDLGANAVHNVYMVAVPKNTAVSMLLGNQIGFANDAHVEDGVIVLAGDRAYVSASASPGRFTRPLSSSVANSVTVQDGTNFTSAVDITAQTFTATATSATGITFAKDASLTGMSTAALTVDAGSKVTAGGNLTLSSVGDALVTSPFGGFTSTFKAAGSATLTTSGTLGVTGALTINSHAVGLDGRDGERGFTVGGSTSSSQSASLVINGGTVSAGVTTIDAGGTGGDGLYGGGTGNGGAASLTMSAGSASFASLAILADGIGGGGDYNNLPSGDGHAGSVTLTVSSPATPTPAFTVAGTLSLSAQGTGGTALCSYCYDDAIPPNVYAGEGVAGGNGTGNQVTASITNTRSSIGSLVVNVSGTGGAGELAAGTDSDGIYYNGGAGGTGQAGTATVTLAANVASAGGITMTATGTGGAGGGAYVTPDGTDSGNGGQGGTGTGGTLNLDFTGGTFSNPTAALSLSADGVGGAGGLSERQTSGADGTATGGTASLTGSSPSPVSAGSVALSGSSILLSGNLAADTLDLIAQDTITFGNGSTPSLMDIGGYTQLEARNGEIRSNGAATVRSATELYVTAAQGINAPGLSLVARDNLWFSIDGSLVLHDASGAYVGIPADGPAGPLVVNGGVAISGTLASSAGNLDLSTNGGNISIGRVAVADGSDLRLDAGEGSISVGDASPSTLGTMANATFRGGGTVSVQNLAATGSVDVRGGAVSITGNGALAFSNLQAISGDISVSTDGAITADTASAAGNISLSSGDRISVDALNAGGTFAAEGTDIFAQSTDALHVASATATAGNLSLIADSLTVDSASANSDLSLHSATDLAFGSLSASTLQLQADNGRISGATLEAFNGQTIIASGSVSIDDDVNQSGSGTIQGSSVTIGSTGALALTDVTATSGAISLSSSSDLTIFGGLSGPGNIDLSGANVTVITNDPLSVSSAHATNGDLTLQSGGNLSVQDGRASGAVRLVSGDGGITTGSLSFGTDLVLESASDLTVGDYTVHGIASFVSTDGALTVGTINADGAVSVGAATNVSFTSLTGQSVQAGAGRALSGGTVVSRSTAVLAADGAVSVTGNVAAPGGVTAVGTSVNLVATGALPITSALATDGDLTINAAGDLIANFTHASGATRFTSTGGTIQVTSLTTGTDLLLHSATDLAIGDLSLTGSADLASSGGALSIGSLTATGTLDAVAATNLRFTALGGSIVRARAGGALTGGTLTSASTARLLADGPLAITTNIAAPGGVLAQGSSISLVATGPLSVTNATATHGDLTLQSAGDLTLGSGRATGAISLTSSGGSVSVHDAAVGTVRLASAGIHTAAVNSSDIDIKAAGTAAIDGTTTTSGAVNVTANAADVTGTVIGSTIAFRTSGITIGNLARIGLAGTTTNVTFQNIGSQRSFLGGSSGGGYLLSASGLAKVQSDAILAILPQLPGSSQANPDVTINTLTLRGSNGTPAGALANLTPNGSFTIQTPGTIRVAGALTLTDLGPNNSFVVTAGPEIDIVTPSGSIALTDSNGAPAGSAVFGAGRMIVASQQALDDLNGLTDTPARGTRLAVNDGPVTDDGYIVADHLTFRISSLLDVQNSGGSLASERRGVTAGTGGIDVILTGTGTPEVILNARGIDPTGAPLAGKAVLSLVRLSAVNGGVPVLTTGSTINGCSLGSTSCGSITPDEYMPYLIPPQDTVAFLSNDGGDGNEDTTDETAKNEARANPTQVINKPLISFVRANPYSYGSVIDEPVTGAPNDDLWIDSCLTGSCEQPIR